MKAAHFHPRRSLVAALLVIPLHVTSANAADTTFEAGVPPRAELPQSSSIPASDFAVESFRSTNIDSFIEAQMDLGHVAGLSACIVKEPGRVWTGAYGTADFDLGAEVHIETLFMLASISKVVTATALMQLWEDGAFGLDDDVNDYLPFTVSNPSYPGVPLTFRMLLTHTSSIQDNWSVMPYYPGDSPVPLGDYLADYLVPGGGLYDPVANFYGWEPGTGWGYCNIAIALVGYLVEVLSGQTFPEYCQQEIFAPLGMSETAWHLADLDESHIAMPYWWNGQDHEPYGHYGYTDYPSGQLRTSVDQLGQFLLAYVHGGEWNNTRLLESATVDSILSPQIPDIDPTQGLVWYQNGPAWGHNGGDQGVSTNMYFIREMMLGVIVLNNGENHNVTNEITTELFYYGIETSDVAESSPHMAGIGPLVAYPNPCNSATTISYRHSEGGPIRIAIFDTGGRKVRTLVKTGTTAGTHPLHWDGRNDAGRSLPSGLYLCRVRGAKGAAVCRLWLLK